MKINQDYYLIVDLEATCTDDQSIPRQRMEIIEIGAVMLNARTLQLDSEYQSFIKPVLHPRLTDFCKSLTSISQQDVDLAPLFPDALKDFQSWFYPFDSYFFCSWGDYDKTQFKQDCKLHNVGYPFPGGHLTSRRHFLSPSSLKRNLAWRQLWRNWVCNLKASIIEALMMLGISPELSKLFWFFRVVERLKRLNRATSLT